MKRTFFFMLLLFLLNPLYLSAQAKPVGKLSKVEGRVDITSPGASARTVNTGDEVSVGDIIRVKSKSKAEIVFADGGILRIAQKSRVKIDEYIMEEKRKSGVFNLFRGKIENVVKKGGGFFGFKKKNKHEVHTPTAVCGVRGTDFFSTYQKGISNFVFKEGQGYGYSKNKPDNVIDINKGQAMMVIKPDIPPIVRMATANEIAAHSADMDIKKEEDKDEEKKGDESIGEGQDDKKRGDKARDKKSRDDEPEGREPGDDDRVDDKRGDSEKDDRSRSRYARAGDKSGDDDRLDDDEPGDDRRGDHRRGDRGPRDGRPDRYGPRDDRRGDDSPDDYGPRDGRRADYGPRDGRRGDDVPHDYGPRDHRPDGPPHGDYRAGDYGPEGPPRGDYGPGGPPPGEYWGEGPPPPGEYWGEGPPPPGEYWGEGPPPGEYWGEGPPPGEYWGEGPPPGEYWGEGPPPGEYWGEGPPPGEYWGEGPPPGEYWGEGPPPGEYWGEGPPPGDFYAGDYGSGDYYGGDFYGDDFYGDDFYGDDFLGDDFLGDDFFDPDIAFDIDDYLIPPFSVDNISISGNSGDLQFSLSMSGKYDAPPPFVYMYEDIRGALSGSLKSGYFFGFTACGWKYSPQTVEGIAAFFYIDSGDASGGLFMGDVSGSYSTDLHDWNASGSLDWVELGSGLTVPGSVAGITDYPRDIFIVSGSGSGNFYDAGSDIGDFNIYGSDGIFDSIQEGQHWGFWQNHIGSTYSTISGKTLVDCDDWFLEWEQKGWEVDNHILSLRLYMSAKGTIPHYRNVVGDVAGGWVDIDHAVTGIAIGELNGGYNPYSNEIFAGGGGVWLETAQLLTMAGTPAGRANLVKLDIPSIEIGKVTLTGSSIGVDRIENITMTDVTFLAHTSGGTPRIWATNSVTGDYVGTPSAGLSASLTGGGVSAQFNLRTWNTSENKWDATVTDGAGTVGGHNITFKGGAAGAIDTGTKEISGTAAGWAHKN